MNLPILIDMNLSPAWVKFLIDAGWPAVHWSTIGANDAPDREIMDWAVEQEHVVFTHDLDFGTTLALTHASGPSVLQVRATNILPDVLGPLVITALEQYADELETGALVVVDKAKSRVRILPMNDNA